MPRVDGRHELTEALRRAGFRRDARAADAYSLVGQEGHMRVDLGGSRSKSARFQRKHGDAYSGVGPTLYFGYVRSAADAEGWARYFHALATDVPGARHPAIQKPKEPRPETVARRERVREEKHGRGFYVVNATTAGARVGAGGLYLPLAANHGPFATLDEALPVAWDQYQEYLQMRFTYLLPVQIIESKSRQAAERGEGYAWWADGKARAAPVPEEQASLGFAGRGRSRVHARARRTA